MAEQTTETQRLSRDTAKPDKELSIPAAKRERTASVVQNDLNDKMSSLDKIAEQRDENPHNEKLARNEQQLYSQYMELQGEYALQTTAKVSHAVQASRQLVGRLRQQGVHSETGRALSEIEGWLNKAQSCLSKANPELHPGISAANLSVASEYALDSQSRLMSFRGLSTQDMGMLRTMSEGIAKHHQTLQRLEGRNQWDIENGLLQNPKDSNLTGLYAEVVEPRIKRNVEVGHDLANNLRQLREEKVHKRCDEALDDLGDANKELSKADKARDDFSRRLDKLGDAAAEVEEAMGELAKLRTLNPEQRAEVDGIRVDMERYDAFLHGKGREYVEKQQISGGREAAHEGLDIGGGAVREVDRYLRNIPFLPGRSDALRGLNRALNGINQGHQEVDRHYRHRK